MRKKEGELRQLQQEHVKMLKQLRRCKPLPSSLGGHLLALTDPATSQPLTDGQLEAEMATFFFAGRQHPARCKSWDACGKVHARIQAPTTKLTLEYCIYTH